MRLALATTAVAICAIALRMLRSGDFAPDLDTATRVTVQLTDDLKVLDRLSATLSHKTVSSLAAPDHILAPENFEALHATLFKAFPEAFKTLKLDVVNKYSLMLTWPGSLPKLQTRPTVFISHIDVVAAGDAKAEAAWTHGPFSGKIADGFAPARTAVFAFGHDEEVAGNLGAGSMAELLKERGMQPYLFMDEGGVVLEDGLPPLVRDAPVAIVSVAEKGYVSIDMSVKGDGGHSSMPPVRQPTVVEQLGKVLQKLHANPPPTRLVPPVPGLLRELSRGSTSGLVRRLLGHCQLWGLRTILAKALSKSSPELAALVRTTMAVTDLSASPPGHNVIPDTATAHVNFRSLPGEDPEFAQKYLRSMASKAGVEVQLHVYESKQASVVTDVRGVHYRQLKSAILETLAPPTGMIVAPELLAGMTDSACWARVFPSTPILRFTPVSINRTAGDLKRIHGVDERVRCSSYLDAVKFYVRYMQTSL